MKPKVLSAVVLIALVCLLGASGGKLVPAAAQAGEDEGKQVVYVSTLGELLSYTYDVYTQSSEGKPFRNYTVVLTCDMDVHTDTSWQAFVPDWELYGWRPRSTYADIEGAGHTISNVWGIPKPGNEIGRSKVGLFDCLLENSVRNLNVTYDNAKMIQKPDVVPDAMSAYDGLYGGLAVEAQSAHIRNVHVKGDFYLVTGTGGIVNSAVFTRIEQCSFEGDLVGGDVGGICGFAPGTDIVNCFYYGAITAMSGGGLVESPRSAAYMVPGNTVELSHNVAVVTELRAVDFGYREECRPRGTLIGTLIGADVENLRLAGNYVLNAEGYAHASFTPDNLEHVGAPTQTLDFSAQEVTGFDTLGSFADASLLSGLDFKNHWYMDEEKGLPQLKRNFVSIIDLSEEKIGGNFVIRTADRFYTADEQGKVEARIRDKSKFQLIYFTLDGVDVLSSLTPDSLPLLMTRSHVLVVKAAPMGKLKLRGLQFAETVRVNGKRVSVHDGECVVPYAYGDSAQVTLIPKNGHTFASAAGIGDEIEVTQSTDGFTVSTKKQSVLQVPTAEIETTFERSKSLAIILVSCTLGGAAIAAATIVLFIRIRNKRKKKA